MCRMVFNPAHPGSNESFIETERAGNRLRQTTNLCPVLSSVLYQSPVRPLEYRKQGLACKIRLRIPRNREIVDLCWIETSHLQAHSDRFGWKAGPMFDTPETFFLDGSLQFSVFQNHR